MAQVLKHLKNSTIADGPDPNQVNPSDWNAAHVFSGGALGGLLMRDTGDPTYGATWLASVAAGSVLISNGVGAAPTWAASLTLGGNLTVNGVVTVTVLGAHNFISSGAGINRIAICNTAAGTGNLSQLLIGNDTSQTLLQINSQSSNYASSGVGDYAGGSILAQSGAGGLTLNASNAAGKIELWTNGAKRWTVNSLGYFVNGNPASAGTVYTNLTPGLLVLGNPAGGQLAVSFQNDTGQCGSIQTNANTTAYLQTSDARLKTDRGLARSTTILERTEIHEYDWPDGTPGRGVFSQDAYTILPVANAPGTDERDAAGRLVRPWSTDYSKYVPDLIVGWQQHAARIAALEAAVARG
jgi:hypothetical protein